MPAEAGRFAQPNDRGTAARPMDGLCFYRHGGSSRAIFWAVADAEARRAPRITLPFVVEAPYRPPMQGGEACTKLYGTAVASVGW